MQITLMITLYLQCDRDLVCWVPHSSLIPLLWRVQPSPGEDSCAGIPGVTALSHLQKFSPEEGLLCRDPCAGQCKAGGQNLSNITRTAQLGGTALPQAPPKEGDFITASPEWEQSSSKTQGYVTLHYAMHSSAHHNILRHENKPWALLSLSGFAIKQILLG